MRPFDRPRAVRDALAGFKLAAMSIPQALGYARIAGAPAVTGLYTLLLPLLAFAAFGSSRYLVVTADSATAAILAGGLSGIAPAGSPRYMALASMVALLTGGFLLLSRLLKLGFLADFLSQTVLTGFLTGVGFQVGIAMLGPMLGLEVHSRRSLLQLAQVLGSLAHIHLPSFGFSLLVIASVLTMDRLAPRFPGPMIAVAGSVAASALWNFPGHGIGTIGPVASGLPRLTVADLSWRDATSLIPVAGSCFLMIVAQSAAVARAYGVRHREPLDENADLLGLSAANAAAALSGTFVVNGSPTQTAMVEGVGGRSQIAQVTTAAAVALVLMFLTRPLQYLPQCVLGAIVFIVAIRLVDLQGLRGIRRESPGEFALAATTGAVVVLLGVEQGIILAMVSSLLRIVAHSYHPHTAVLVHQAAGGIWQLQPVAPGVVSEPGLVIYRFGAALFYANAGRFADEIRILSGGPVRWILVDAGAITRMDYSAARKVEELQPELAKQGTRLAFAHVGADLRADLDRHRLTDLIGRDGIFDTLHEAIAAFRSQ